MKVSADKVGVSYSKKVKRAKRQERKNNVYWIFHEREEREIAGEKERERIK